MSRQDKATTERHTKTLRELVKRPENKVCADCKRNDPRWASWNIGVFLCIRCSGIHRGMGTHISKVKSVDLDMWTPEQMESIQKWGNTRANLYWEAHLKPGHIPPEHKMEAFIRSKYESRRWAQEGPPPKDPSVLEHGREAQHEPEPQPSSLPPPPSSKSPPTKPLVRPTADKPLISAEVATSKATSAATSTATSTKSTVQNDLFNLDFHNATSTSTSSTASPAVPASGQKDVKSSILSLYNNTPTAGSGILNGGFGVAQPTMPPVTSMMATTGTGMWGAQPSLHGTGNNMWGQPVQPSKPPIQGNVWAQAPQSLSSSSSAPAQNSSMFGQNVWNSPTSGSGGTDLFSPVAAASAQPVKKEDAFGDLWAGFK